MQICNIEPLIDCVGEGFAWHFEVEAKSLPKPEHLQWNTPLCTYNKQVATRRRRSIESCTSIKKGENLKKGSPCFSFFSPCCNTYSFPQNLRKEVGRIRNVDIGLACVCMAQKNITSSPARASAPLFVSVCPIHAGRLSPGLPFSEPDFEPATCNGRNRGDGAHPLFHLKIGVVSTALTKGLGFGGGKAGISDAMS
jgi:hypothetical protein